MKHIHLTMDNDVFKKLAKAKIDYGAKSWEAFVVGLLEDYKNLSHALKARQDGKDGKRRT